MNNVDVQKAQADYIYLSPPRTMFTIPKAKQVDRTYLSHVNKKKKHSLQRA